MPSASRVANSSWRCTAATALSTSFSGEMTITEATTLRGPVSGKSGTAVAATLSSPVVTVPCVGCPGWMASPSIG